MRIGLAVYGSLDVVTGGNIYDRLLVARLRARGDVVHIIPMEKRTFLGNLADSVSVRFPEDVDVLLQDELTHPSFLIPNRREHRSPVVSIVHNLHSSERRPRWQNAIYRAIEKHYLASVDGLVLNSGATLDSVRTRLGIHKPFVVAAPGGDRLGSWTAEAVTARAFEAGPLRVVFLANITALKGLRVLLDAMASLPADRFELDIVGSCEVEPVYADAMRRQASRLAARVVFHGILDGKPLIERLRRAQLMAIPSYYEGFGIAYLEGMGFGLPAIGTRAGAVPEIISSGQNGLLIEPGDSASLAACLKLLDSDRNVLARMAGSALKYYKSRPTWDKTGDVVRGFLIRLLAGKTSEGRQSGTQ
jgi:glycosyltransferase involved in cell wall biosynthesis